MPRVQINEQFQAGSGASISIFDEKAKLATLYAHSTGIAYIKNPVVIDGSDAVLDFWVDQPEPRRTFMFFVHITLFDSPKNPIVVTLEIDLDAPTPMDSLMGLK